MFRVARVRAAGVSASRVSAAFVCVALAELASLCALAPRPASAAPAAQPERFAIGRVKYTGGGDWYSNPSSLPNIQKALTDRVGIATESEERRVSLLDASLFETPFLYMNGHGTVTFSSEEADRLRRFLKAGGFLWADDNYGMDESFRPEMRKVFPDAEWVDLPFDHEIYRAFYDLPGGIPKIHEHHGGPARGLGIYDEGRLVVFYSYNTDIGDGTEDAGVHDDPPDKREAAMKMAMNVIVYALSH